MFRTSIFRRCATTTTTTTASAAAAAASSSSFNNINNSNSSSTTGSSSNTNDTSSPQQQQQPRKRKLYIDKRKELYGMRILMASIVAGTYLLLQYMTKRVHTDHQFIPVYNEEGNLEGFTHPALVQAADRIREKKKQ